MKKIAAPALIAALFIFLPLAAAQDEAEKPQRYVGVFTAEQVLEHSEQYADAAFIYIPDADALDVFSRVKEAITIKLFYRTDCIDSIHHVPPFIKTIQLADNPFITVEYIGVNRAKDEPADMVAGWDIQLVPTFVVLHGGEEIGRVIETPQVKIEVDLAQMLQPYAN